MKKSSKKLIEHLLLRRIVWNDLENEEDRQLREELESSPEAKKLANFLQAVSHSVREPDANDPEPLQQTKALLLNAFESKVAAVKRQERGSLVGWLKFRVPVYQAGIALFACALAFFTLGRIEAQNPHSAKNTQIAQSGPEALVQDSLSIIQNVRQLDEQRRGRTIKEDSLLIKFIVTTVDLF